MRAVLFLAAGALFAQTPDTRLAYEAASVKLDTSGSAHSGSDATKGQIVITNLTIERLIERAYGVKPTQVSGPGWLNDVHVDIVAKFPPDTKDSDHPAMLRTLLEDRFKLAVHRETKELPGYALVVAKGGFKLKPVEVDDDDTRHQGGRIQTLSAKGTSMATLADLVSRYLNILVIDKSNVAGVYNFDLRWSTEDSPAETVDQPPTLPVVLEEILGLRMQPQKVPVEVIVVDRVERTPIEN
jgi:uncharacterized protein (TIGR03435 family)